DDVQVRQRDLLAEELQRGVKRVEPEVRVLEKAEQREVGRDGDDQTELAVAGVGPAQEAQPREVAHQRGEEHEQCEPRIPVSVEHVAGNGEPDVARARAAQSPESEIRDGEEREEKDYAVEEHATGR